MTRRFKHGPRLEFFCLNGKWWCRASGFERQPISPADPWDGKTVTVQGTTGPAVYVAWSPKPDLKNCELAWSFNREKYLAWFVENHAASMPLHSPPDLIKAQKILLETLFPNGWFVNAKGRNLKHPAYIRWQRCEDWLARNGRIHASATEPF